MFSKFYDFNETKKRFAESMPDTNFPLTYDEWMQIPKDKKAVALFLSFNQVIASVIKSHMNIDLSGADIIHEIMVVFVSITVNFLEENPQSYNVNFIKKTVKNAILTRNRTQNQYQHNDISKYNHRMEMSNIQTTYNEDTDIFDTIPDEHYLFREIIIRLVHELVTDNMNNLTKDQRSVVKSLLHNKPFATRRKYKVPRVMAELREILAEPAFYMYADPRSDKIGIHLDCDTFEDVLLCAELIRSAVVEMPDGTTAVWLGDTDILYKKYSKIRSFKFIQGKTTYCIPYDQALTLKVLSVEKIS